MGLMASGRSKGGNRANSRFPLNTWVILRCIKSPVDGMSLTRLLDFISSHTRGINMNKNLTNKSNNNTSIFTGNSCPTRANEEIRSTRDEDAGPRFLQINCARSYNSMCDLGQRLLSDRIDLCMIQEPLTRKGMVIGLPSQFRIIKPKNMQSGHNNCQCFVRSIMHTPAHK